MATIDRRPNGKWRAQVRREGRALSKTFIMKGDAEAWVREAETSIERGEDLKSRKPSPHTTFGSLIDRHIDDLEISQAYAPLKGVHTGAAKTRTGR
jgi:hypothetical protein